MELPMPPPRIVTALLAVATVLIIPAYTQVSTPCNPSMIASFTPCMNFVTNSSTNGTSPTSACCNALKSLTSSSMDCVCLIVTGSVPFQVPINRTLAISLPRACNMPGIPLGCKSAGSPIPAPGPASLEPTPSPAASPPSAAASPPSASPTASFVPNPISPALSPESDTTPAWTPPSTTTDGSEAPTATTGSRTAVTPSAAAPSHGLSASVLLFAMGCLVMKFY